MKCVGYVNWYVKCCFIGLGNATFCNVIINIDLGGHFSREFDVWIWNDWKFIYIQVQVQVILIVQSKNVIEVDAIVQGSETSFW